jgi:hypothetical protein
MLYIDAYVIWKEINNNKWQIEKVIRIEYHTIFTSIDNIIWLWNIFIVNGF